METLKVAETWTTPDSEALANAKSYKHYRSVLKPNWYTYYWPLRALIEISDHTPLPALLAEILYDIIEAGTLIRSLPEISEEVLNFLETHDSLVQKSDAEFPMLTNLPIVAVQPSRKLIHSMKKKLQRITVVMHKLVRDAGLDIGKARCLEIGAGAGFLSIALSAVGAGNASGGEVISSDVAFPKYPTVALQPAMRTAFGNPKVRFMEAVDAASLPFEDGSIDLVHSTSVLEHLPDLRSAFREIHRVLRPGGLVFHRYDPWFHPGGGHSLCSLDIPWGHVWLTREGFKTYLSRNRMYEYEFALHEYDFGFHSPRFSLAFLEKLSIQSGFRILDWTESNNRFSGHAPLIDEKLLEACLTRHPDISVRDLLTDSVSFLLQKPISRFVS